MNKRIIILINRDQNELLKQEIKRLRILEQNMLEQNDQTTNLYTLDNINALNEQITNPAAWILFFAMSLMKL